MTFQRFLVFCVLSVGVTTPPDRASACTCIVGLNKGFLFPAKGAVPANGRGIAWWGGGTRYGSVRALRKKVTFQVLRLHGRRLRPVTFRVRRLEPGLFLIEPSGGFSAGGTYRFRYAWGATGRSVLVHVHRYVLKPNAPKPILRVTKTQKKARLNVRAGGACTVRVRAAAARVEVKLPKVLQQYAGAFFFSTFTNGSKKWRPATSYCHQVPPGSSWKGKGKDLIYSTCGLYLGDNGLKAGHHTVKMELWLPGTSIRLTTNTVRIKLVCK